MERSEGTLLIINNVRLVNEGIVTSGSWVVVEGEMILATGTGPVPAELEARASETIDGAGKLLMPGVIDEHVHFRDPGLTHKGDMATESAAAAAGGVTSFIDMPNTNPPTVTLEALEDKIKRASEVATANYGFFLGATNSNIDTLLAADYSRIAGVKLFLGSSTGNMLVDTPSTIERIFKEIKALIAVHAEDEATIAANRRALIERYGRELPIAAHPVIRNHEACYLATKRAVELARATDARLHVLHISTSDELRFFQPGPVAEKRITCETCPQYLIFTDEMYPALGARIKCNPAIKRPTDRDDILFALNHDIIDTIGTDHAPHLLSEKQGTALTAVSGMPGLQFALPVMMDMVREGLLTVETLVRKTCHAPAELLRIDRRGFIRPGYYADLVLFDDDCEPYEITDSSAMGKCGWTPYAGLQLNGKVEMTLLNGRIVYRHGVVFGDVRGRALRFNQK